MNAKTTPLTRKRRPPARGWPRFRAHRRGFFSLQLLIILYVLSLVAELISNDKPLLMRINGHMRFPAFVSYTQHTLLNNDIHTRMTDYEAFVTEHRASIDRLIMAPFKSGARQTFTATSLEPHRRMQLVFTPLTYAAAVQINADGAILYAFGDTNYFAAAIADLPTMTSQNNALAEAISQRFSNKPAGAFDLPVAESTLALAPFTPRPHPPDSVRIMFRSPEPLRPIRATVLPNTVATTVASWPGLSLSDVSNIISAAETAPSSEWVPPVAIIGTQGTNIIAQTMVSLEPVSWPFRPVPGHPMGFDAAGRDVFARLFYALRTSLTFGLALVSVTMLLGILAGAIQGYFAGWVDITGQRMTEIWSALPFLYIIILLGNILGRSFSLLLICYAMFNWIGIAAYVRAEFLRLRGHAFVDAARCQGLSGPRIMFKHILPNAITPLITLLPFALVGAIGSLAVLDYLGFGLPAGSPSWGELLNQAQAFRSAWWLILYPSLALFTVMLLGVFIGEGLRDALDPRPYSKME